MNDERVKEKSVYDEMDSKEFIGKMYNEFSREIGKLKSSTLNLEDRIQNLEKLEMCPFCGSDDIHYEDYMSEGWRECYNCGAKGPVSNDAQTDRLRAEQETLKLWNERKYGLEAK